MALLTTRTSWDLAWSQVEPLEGSCLMRGLSSHATSQLWILSVSKCLFLYIHLIFTYWFFLNVQTVNKTEASLSNTFLFTLLTAKPPDHGRAGDRTSMRLQNDCQMDSWKQHLWFHFLIGSYTKTERYLKMAVVLSVHFTSCDLSESCWEGELKMETWLLSF